MHKLNPRPTPRRKRLLLAPVTEIKQWPSHLRHRKKHIKLSKLPRVVAVYARKSFLREFMEKAVFLVFYTPCGLILGYLWFIKTLG